MFTVHVPVRYSKCTVNMCPFTTSHVHGPSMYMYICAYIDVRISYILHTVFTHQNTCIHVCVSLLQYVHMYMYFMSSVQYVGVCMYDVFSIQC